MDAKGNAYVTGFTNSSDFPTEQAFQPANAGGLDAFVTKIAERKEKDKDRKKDKDRSSH